MSKDREVGVKLHLRQPADAQRRQAVVGLEFSEQALYGSASAVEVTEALRVARDHRQEPSPDADGQGWLLALHALERDDGQHGEGAIELHEPVAATSRLGEKAIRDAALSADGAFLYALDADSQEVYAWLVGDGGELAAIGAIDGLPATVAGLAAL